MLLIFTRCMMKKILSFLIALVGVVIVVGALSGTKILQIKSMVQAGKSSVPPPETVSVTKVQPYEWESVLTAVGSLQAVQGVMVSADLPGRVSKIAFKSGMESSVGTLLLQQDISVELAEQRSIQSELKIAKKNYDRSLVLLPKNVISQTMFEESRTRYEKAMAQLENIGATIAKKTVKAPFSGRLGIRQVNLGEILTVGQPIVSLQSLDPIYVNFLLPQQQIGRLKNGLQVRVTIDALAGQAIQGNITAINSEVDTASRNIRVQATLNNTTKKLRPGMYASVDILLPEKNAVIAIPITAVLYATYSDSVFVIEKAKEGEGKVIRQQFVQLGKKQGDFVSVRSGLKKGDTVVSTGVFKLRSGQSVIVDNTIKPEFKMAPRPGNA